MLVEQHSRTRVGPTDLFAAADAFQVGKSMGGRILSAVGWSFAEHFLPIVEREVSEAHVSGWTLLYTAGDESLIKATGGQDVELGSIAYVHCIMDLGEKGPSHLDWRSNFAYARSPVDGRLWAVHWNVNYANEWNIGAVYVPHPELDWRAGSRMFTKQSLDGRNRPIAGVPITNSTELE